MNNFEKIEGRMDGLKKEVSEETKSLVIERGEEDAHADMLTLEMSGNRIAMTGR
jgi:hypothetical protein